MPPTVRIDVLLLRKAIRSASRPLVHRIIAKLGPVELAQAFPDLSPTELKFIAELLLEDRDRLTLTLRALPENLVPEIAANLGDPLLARAIGVLDPDDAKQLLQELQEEDR